MNIKKQIEYWIRTAKDDMETAEILINNKKILQGLFFCHLCIEKTIKAHVVRYTNDIPPKIHNLSYLLEKTDVALDDAQLSVIDILMYYQLEGRYPENNPKTPAKEKALIILTQKKKLFIWLKKKL